MKSLHFFLVGIWYKWFIFHWLIYHGAGFHSDRVISVICVVWAIEAVKLGIKGSRMHSFRLFLSGFQTIRIWRGVWEGCSRVYQFLPILTNVNQFWLILANFDQCWPIYCNICNIYCKYCNIGNRLQILQ